MIFNEIYSVYYNTVAKIIDKILLGNVTEKDIEHIVRTNAFGESSLNILPSLKNEKWQLVKNDLTTPVKHKPTMPLTNVQKMWLKAIELDPRIKLFGVTFPELGDTEPLFTADDYCIYDKYSDGDPYQDENYITHFRTLLAAVKEKHPLRIEMLNRKGNVICATVIPVRLEYSEKDDKFRLICNGSRYIGTVNLARIVNCKRYFGDVFAVGGKPVSKRQTVALRILNERNALERCMLHFAHLEKQAERIDEKNYLVRIYYDESDETEMVIRILGFGPMVEVVEPQRFRNLIIERLKKQKSCEL